jgi:hypothetical protein
LAVTQRELDEGETVNGVVEEGSVSNREVCIVALSGVPGHVEIASDDPRGIVRGLMRGEIL